MRESGSPLSDWNRRVEVAIGAARGLAHIHNLDPPIVHGRLRSRSIQLDSNGIAKIGGLAAAHLLGPAGIHVRGLKSRISGLGYVRMGNFHLKVGNHIQTTLDVEVMVKSWCTT